MIRDQPNFGCFYNQIELSSTNLLSGFYFFYRAHMNQGQDYTLHRERRILSHSHRSKDAIYSQKSIPLPLWEHGIADFESFSLYDLTIPYMHNYMNQDLVIYLFFPQIESLLKEMTVILVEFFH